MFPLKTASENAPGYDLLTFGPLRWLVHRWFFPGLIQLILLGAFVALAMMGWGVTSPQGVPDKLFAKSSLVTLAI